MNSGISALSAMWITMRPYLLFVSGITGIAGMAVASTVAPVPLFAVFLASFFAYGFGQALTDCFQMDTDAISAPYRPLVAGTVSRRTILLMSLAGLTACVCIFAIRNPINLAVGAAGAVGLATYTPFKRRWWGGPWYNAWIVVALCIMGFLGATGTGTIAWPPSLAPLLAAVFFGYANFVLSGYFKDIDADAVTGYVTFPVRFGRRAAALASDVFALLFLGSSVWAAVRIFGDAGPEMSHLFAVPFAVAGLSFLVGAQVLLHRNSTDREAHRPIMYVVHAYILLLSALAVLLHPGWTPFLAVHYALFIIVLSRRPEVAQV